MGGSLHGDWIDGAMKESANRLPLIHQRQPVLLGLESVAMRMRTSVTRQRQRQDDDDVGVDGDCPMRAVVVVVEATAVL